MKLTQLTVGSIGTNCYMLYDETSKAAVVMDPSDEAVLVAARIEALGLDVKAVLLTHGHFDHSGEAAKIADRAGVPIWMHPADRALPSWLTHGLPDTRDLADGETLDFAGLQFTVIHTPGHTPGSVCFRCGDLLFAGDTLFAGSCGRTDLPGGSWQDMAASLRRLAALEGDCTVYPGHGEATTLEAEQAENPYLKMALEQS
ncbi:MAG: MBL fold metallo-hydrolase [Oscillospiraceae bacterium]|nr:MBL fold metallo-hydrolase [Oscillospiraceae bacterium]